MNLEDVIRNVPDFPKPGIQFKDITTLLLDPAALRYVIDTWRERYADRDIDVIVGADARGFIFGGALAYAMDKPFAVARKIGKLPAATIAEEYVLEYGTNTVEMHTDAVRDGQRVLLIDVLLATGGTTAAIVRLVKRLGGEVIEAAYVVELPPLNGRAALDGVPVHSLVSFMVD